MAAELGELVSREAAAAMMMAAAGEGVQLPSREGVVEVVATFWLRIALAVDVAKLGIAGFTPSRAIC